MVVKTTEMDCNLRGNISFNLSLSSCLAPKLVPTGASVFSIQHST